MARAPGARGTDEATRMSGLDVLAGVLVLLVFLAVIALATRWRIRSRR